jgi:hypothetical protein
VCVVYQVMNLLVYFEPAASCDNRTELILAPLPAKKQLWEAGDKYVWKAESSREPGTMTDFGLTANGELIKLGGGQRSGGDAVDTSTNSGAILGGTENWEEWCSGMDGFGGLVMLAAALIV